METNTNTPEAKQPAGAGCHPTTCSPLDYRQLYETECKDHAFMRKTLERVIAERDKIHAALVKLDGIYRHDLDHPAHRPDWLRDTLSLENAKDMGRATDSESI